MSKSVAVLLSTYNGERWLTEQLGSLRAQTHQDWILYWRDDGSSDASRLVVAAADLHGKCIAVSSEQRMYATGSFLFLLRQALAGSADYFAFADQDDVWMPDKLARAVRALASVPAGQPGLFFCSRRLVDASLRPIGLVPAPEPPPRFPAALTQNIVPGCCMVLNRAAAALVTSLPVPEGAWHDWWAYIVVSAHDGVVLSGEEPDILYRQHGGNLVGEPSGFWSRMIAAARRGRGPFITLFWRHVGSLSKAPGLPAASRAILQRIETAQRGGFPARLRALFIPGFSRQAWAEDLIFRLWFLLG